LTIKFSTPKAPNSEREVTDITVDNLLIKETDLSKATDNLLTNISHELQEVDKSINYVITKTTNLTSENTENTKYQKIRYEKRF